MLKRALLLTIAFVLLTSELALAQGERMARLDMFRGEVSVVRSGVPLTLYRDMRVQSADRIITRAGIARLIFLDGSEMRVRPNSDIQVTDNESGGREVDVFFGRLWTSVKRWRQNRTRFRTGSTIAAVRGTTVEWSVSLGPCKDVRMGLSEGGPLQVTILDALGKSHEITLTAGFQIMIPCGDQAPVGPTPFTPGEIIDEIDPEKGFTGTWETDDDSPSRLILPCGECGVPNGRGECEDENSLCPDTACRTNRQCRNQVCIGGSLTSSKEDPNCP